MTTPTQITAALLLILVLLALAVWWFVHPRPTTVSVYPPACTHTATPTSSMTVQSWLGSATPGSVLCLEPGTYTGGSAMLFVAQGQGGSESQPLWIRARDEGSVLIDGQFGQRPLDCTGADVIFWGMNLRDGNDSVLVLRGTRCQARRIVAWSTASSWGIDNLVDLGGTYNVLEDVGAFGYARKGMAAGARGGRSGNVLRRVYVDWNGFIPSAGADPGSPTNPLEVGYDQDAVTVENAIVRRNILSSATQPESPLSIFSTRDSWVGGLISYLQPGETIDVNQLGWAMPEGGSHEGSGHVTSNTTLTQSVFAAPSSFTNVAGFVIVGGHGSSGNVADTLVSIAPKRSTTSAEGWTFRNVHDGTTAQEALGGASVWESVPGVCRRYKSRQLTDEALWPWPLEARISAAYVAAGRPAYSVTAAVEQALGAMPATCKTGGTPPIPPQPTPGPVALSCSGDLLASGKIAMDCVPKGEGRR